MTNETIQNIIKNLNAGTLENKVHKQAISQKVEYAKLWEEKKLTSENNSKDYCPYIFFLTKNKSNKYVGVVLDMKTDLHWFILPEERGKGYLTKNLVETILPFISQSREEQKITVNLWSIGEESFRRSQKVALATGFIKIESDNYGKFEFVNDLRKMKGKDD